MMEFAQNAVEMPRYVADPNERKTTPCLRARTAKAHYEMKTFFN